MLHRLGLDHEKLTFRHGGRKTIQRNTPSTTRESFAQSTPAAPVRTDFNAEDFGYSPRKKNPPPEESTSPPVQKEFYDKSLEETDDDPGEQTRRSSLSKVSGIKVGPNLLDHPDDQEQPVRTRNMASVFETTDVFSPSKSGQSRSAERNSIDDRSPRQDEKRPAKSESPKTKVNKSPRAFFESDDDIADSNAMFHESQHVHFPENTSNRSMVKQEMRGHLNYDQATSQSIDSTPMENTEILPDSRMASSPMNFDNEATRHLPPEDLMHSRMPIFPVEPAFPPRDFDIPPYELAPSPQEFKAQQKTSQAVQETPKKVREPIPLSREPTLADREVFPVERDPEPIANDPFAPIRSAYPVGREAPLAQRDSNDPFAVQKPAAPIEARFPQRDAFAAIREMQSDEPPYTQREAPAPVREAPAPVRDAPAPVRDAMPSSKELSHLRTPPPVAPAKPMAATTEPRWSLLRDRLRLLTGVQISRSQASDFVLRLLGENASRSEQQEVLSIFLHMLDTTRQPAAELRFLAFLFEELQPKSLHQLMGALKIGDQTVLFFVDYLQTLLKERQLRRILNVIHAVIVPGLDLSWYQEAYRFLLIVWPELGLKGWYWLAEEGPMVFCDRLADREDLMPATLLA